MEVGLAGRIYFWLAELADFFRNDDRQTYTERVHKYLRKPYDPTLQGRYPSGRVKGNFLEVRFVNDSDLSLSSELSHWTLISKPSKIKVS